MGCITYKCLGVSPLPCSIRNFNFQPFLWFLNFSNRQNYYLKHFGLLTPDKMHQNSDKKKLLVLQLSAIIQTITLECPTALVWCGAGAGSVWHGSPLDLLPIQPSALPMPARCDPNSYRRQLRQAEHSIRERSKRAEGRWCSDKWQACSAGKTRALLPA